MIILYVFFSTSRLSSTRNMITFLLAVLPLLVPTIFSVLKLKRVKSRPLMSNLLLRMERFDLFGVFKLVF